MLIARLSVALQVQFYHHSFIPPLIEQALYTHWPTFDILFLSLLSSLIPHHELLQDRLSHRLACLGLARCRTRLRLRYRCRRQIVCPSRRSDIAWPLSVTNLRSSYGGYLVDKYGYGDAPDTVGWSTSATDLGFVDGTQYDSEDIICHEESKPGALTAPVTAGSKVELQWTEWPESHHGPLITYLADCGADCATVDKKTLKFFKIDAKGVTDPAAENPGVWASDDMIANNGTWAVTIPAAIADGNYVLRHEIIGLHSAGQLDGAQNYPQCVNIKVTGGGDAKPEGTAGPALYKDTDPGIHFDLYQGDLSKYPMPGPELFKA